jgi:hypothetical protein
MLCVAIADQRPASVRGDLGSVKPQMSDDNNEELRDVTHSLP